MKKSERPSMRGVLFIHVKEHDSTVTKQSFIQLLDRMFPVLRKITVSKI